MSVYRPRAKNGSFASPFYQYDFWRKGRRFHGSTGAKTESAARDVERVKKIEADRGLDDTTIEGAFGRFWLEAGQYDRDHDTTFERMEALQDGLARILGEAGKTLSLAAVTEDELAQYVARRRTARGRHGQLLAPGTVNRELAILRRIMRRAANVWKRPLNLPNWKQLFLGEPEEHVVDVPPAIEEKIIAALRPEFGVVVRFLVMSGLRAGSVLASGQEAAYGPLRPDQVDFVAGVITIKMKSKKPGGRTLRLPITRAMKILLANELSKHPDAVFTYRAVASAKGRRHGQCYPITYTAFYSAFKAAAAVVGRPELRPHDLRHTAGNRMLAATGNMRLAQNQLGHTRITTTQRYTHPDIDALRAAMEAVHSAPSPEPTPEMTAPEMQKQRDGTDG